MKKKRTQWMALLLTVLLLAGCTGDPEPVLQSTDAPTTAETAAPVAEATTPENPGTQPLETEAPIPETEAPVIETTAPATEPPQTESSTEPDNDISVPSGAYALYAGPLARYCTALTEQWTEGDYINNEMSSLGAFYCDGDPLENVGFALIDLDGDGTPELIIGAIEDAEVEPVVFEIWTLVDSEPVKIIESHARDRYFLEYHSTAEGENFYLIANDASNGSANFATYYYRLENSTLVLAEGIVFDATANSDSPWFYTTDEDWDPSNDTEIDSETALETTDGHRGHVIAVSYCPFAQY